MPANNSTCSFHKKLFMGLSRDFLKKTKKKSEEPVRLQQSNQQITVVIYLQGYLF